MMPKPIVVITEDMPFLQEELHKLERIADIRLLKSTNKEVILREVSDAIVIVTTYAKITKEIIDSAKNLRAIVRMGIGIDNIDIKVATSKGILVINCPDYAIEAVADYTMALLLCLSRKLIKAHSTMTKRNWGDWSSPSIELRGIELKNKVLGLVGLGRIGRAVVKRAKGFDMRFLAYDPYVRKDEARKLGVELVDLETLLKNSDFVSIHTPLTKETKGMIGEKELELMKKTAFIINTARGSIIDSKALSEALTKGRIAGAALDVYQKEPPDEKEPLLNLENTILSPHIAWYTEEALKKLISSTINSIVAVIQGKTPKNVVNRELLK